MFTPAEQTALAAHAAALGLSVNEYIRQTVADRALSWHREQDAFRAIAQRLGCTVDDLLQRGSLSDD
ncbi:hypothetical protein [Streptomyces sp. SID12488]|uniref:hypothetical protein n=1 Tax=Streptomyces sp. SID12488 TaxID=2706040 RepID=UPI0013D99818|nr:hypothetical protein [Streptomyces sp. SID12488]NEA68665.1 hypothetical protein [Streptomyces sp. SID12488]